MKAEVKTTKNVSAKVMYSHEPVLLKRQIRQTVEVDSIGNGTPINDNKYRFLPFSHSSA